MDQATHNKIVSFIWGIADDVLRDLFRRGKYPDVILPMCVIRRMDAVLEPTKQKVLETKQMLDAAGITEQRAALCDAAGQAFYNTSKFTLRDLKSRGSQQQLLADFEDYLNGFSPNVQDILENFKFRNQLPTLSKNDAIGTLINKFLDPEIDLSPAGIDKRSVRHALQRHRPRRATHPRRHRAEGRRRRGLPERQGEHAAHRTNGPRPGARQGDAVAAEGRHAGLQAVRGEPVVQALRRRHGLRNHQSVTWRSLGPEGGRCVPAP